MVRKTKEEALETRSRVLDAAELVFKRQGVARTSLADIAEAAGVTRGAIYWHFKNKAELFEAMVQRTFGPAEKEFADLRAACNDDPIEGIRRSAHAFLQRAANDPTFQRILEIVWHKCEYVDEMAEIRDRHLDCGLQYLTVHEEAFRAAQQCGQLRDDVDPRQAAVGLMAILDGLIVNWTLAPELFSLQQSECVVDMYMAGLVAGGGGSIQAAVATEKCNRTK